MSDLFKLLKAERNASAKFGAKVRECIHNGGDEGRAEVVGCAEAIEKAFPVKKEDGKDVNKDQRNDYLRSLRMALMRAGRSLSEPVRLTIKKVEGAWQITAESIEKGAESEAGENAGESGGESDEAAQEAADDALWSAVEVVLANLANPAVLSAIRSGLENMAKNAAKV